MSKLRKTDSCSSRTETAVLGITRRSGVASSAGFACALIVLSVLAYGPAMAASGQSAGVKADAKILAAANRKAAVVDAGRIVFNQRCEICHFSDSRAKKIGPGLKDLFARARLANGTRITDSSVSGLISDGGKDMPGYGDLLKPGQIQALIAYLKSN